MGSGTECCTVHTMRLVQCSCLLLVLGLVQSQRGGFRFRPLIVLDKRPKSTPAPVTSRPQFANQIDGNGFDDDAFTLTTTAATTTTRDPFSLSFDVGSVNQ